jgi:hypothetical protein
MSWKLVLHYSRSVSERSDEMSTIVMMLEDVQITIMIVRTDG